MTLQKLRIPIASSREQRILCVICGDQVEAFDQIKLRDERGTIVRVCCHGQIDVMHVPENTLTILGAAHNSDAPPPLLAFMRQFDTGRRHTPVNVRETMQRYLALLGYHEGARPEFPSIWKEYTSGRVNATNTSSHPVPRRRHMDTPAENFAPGARKRPKRGIDL